MNVFICQLGVRRFSYSFNTSAIIAVLFYYLKKKSVSSDQDQVSVDEKLWARKFMFSVIPIFLLPLVPTLTSLPCTVCVQFYPAESEQCRALVLVASYDNKIISLTAIISPQLVIQRDPELRAPFINWINNYRRRYRRSRVKRFSNLLSTIV